MGINSAFKGLIVIILGMSQEVYSLPLYTKYETLGNKALFYGMHVLNEVTLRSDCCLVACRWYKCYALLVFPKRGMCLVFPKRGSCYMWMLQLLRTIVKCPWTAGVL